MKNLKKPIIFLCGLSFVFGLAAATAPHETIFASVPAPGVESSGRVAQAEPLGEPASEPSAAAETASRGNGPATVEGSPIDDDPIGSAIDALREDSPTGAEYADQIEANRAKAPYTVDELQELETFRGQLEGFTADLEQLVRSLPVENVYDYPEKILGARALVGDLSAEDLDLLQSSYSEYEGFWSAPAEILLIMGQQPVSFDMPGASQPDIVPTAPAVPIPQRANCATFGSNPTCSECPAPPAGGRATLIALQAVELTACAACDFIDADFFVGPIEVPNPVKFICTAIKQGIQFARLGVEGALEVNLECQTNYHRALTHALLDETVSSRATQLSFDYFEALTTRLEIEDALLLEEDSRVSRFQLPASQGGFLDRTDGLSVRFIVVDTIHMQRDIAGMTVGNAEDELAAGDAHLAAGEYLDAYARYRKAYRAAVRVGRGN
jgi:hypothetical protein